jgi:hypothetical protein
MITFLRNLNLGIGETKSKASSHETLEYTEPLLFKSARTGLLHLSGAGFGGGLLDSGFGNDFSGAGLVFASTASSFFAGFSASGFTDCSRSVALSSFLRWSVT